MSRAGRLNCGHAPSPHGSATTGTAHTQDGREICWACADKEQRRDLLTETSYTAYLSRAEGKAAGTAWLTTWTGGHLATVTHFWTKRVGFSRDGRTYFRAVDVHGQRWHGTSPGFGMHARMTRSKA